MRAQRYKRGSVRFDKRRGTWNYLWYESGKRRSRLIGTKQQYPNKSAAWKAVESAIKQMPTAGNALTVANLVEHYRQEKMPTRYSTRRAYEVWLRRRILPRWGDSPITDVQARPVELWLQGLNELAPKSRAELRGLLRILWEYAMWRGEVPTQRNPMELVRVKDVTKRRRMPRSLTVQEFHDFSQHLGEPFRTVALVCVCFGLRISECLALKWSDVDWLQGKLRVERGIVRQHVGDVKSAYSQRHMTIDEEMLQVFKAWKQQTQFSSSEDWVFASPSKIGREPWCYDQVLRLFVRAAEIAGIGKIGTHSMRHTYRSWLDAVGTAIAVQQKLMRHADIRTTMNVYGDVVTDEMAQASEKITRLALNGAQTERKAS